jgi:hypothetical protein
LTLVRGDDGRIRFLVCDDLQDADENIAEYGDGSIILCTDDYTIYDDIEDKQVLGVDQFEGRSWKGWHHYVTIVMLTYAFIATERAAQGAAARRPPLPAIARELVYEMATQIAENEGLERPKA